MTDSQDPQQNVPQYGTPEYEQWYQKNVDPSYRPNQPAPPVKKSHRVRNVIAGTFAGIVAVVVIVSVATSGNDGDNPAAKAGPAPTTKSPTVGPYTGKCGSNGKPDTRAATEAQRDSDVAYCQAHPGKADQRGAKAETPAPTTTPPAATTAPPAKKTTPPPAPPATHKPDPKPTLTVAQQNAIGAAQDYLQLEGFSRLGLIGQLSSSAGEGYSVADATFAVDYLHADWNEQAVRSAKSYLSIEHFSRAGLIDQLSSSAGDQYTVAEATYAADHVGL
jgi:hypothetical protein